MMKCTLMHKRIKTAEIEFDSATGAIQKITAIYAPEHLPVGVPLRSGVADRAALNQWWKDRAIPASRTGIREAMETLDIADINSISRLLIRGRGLSLVLDMSAGWEPDLGQGHFFQ